MIKLNKLCMAYGNKLLFYDADLLLNDNHRYALVGANGAGKSTFFKLMNGEEESTSGDVSIPKDASVGWLKQDQFKYEDMLITDVVIQGKPKLWEALTEKEKILNSGEWSDEIGYHLGELEEIIGHYNGYGAEAFAQKLLTGLGIHQNYHTKPLSALSGGYKLRVLLAQALFQQPDILLLDEPTNHLDIVSIDWLEKYLKNEFNGLLIFISHDVDFINQIANNIIDIDYGEIKLYSGNYQKFLSEKKLIEEQKLQQKMNLEAKIADMQSFVDRFKAKASKARQAQSRMKMIEKIELPDISHSSRIAPHFQFKSKRPSGKHVLDIKNLKKSYGDKSLFSRLHSSIHRGERISIIGANGMGKSTLIKILLNKISADEGEFTWGHETHISYFSQEHHDLLDKHMNALEWLTSQVSLPEQQVRKALGQMLFKQDDVTKDILSLSGGEAARLLFTKMILESPNVLVLDEPTNHLDIETIEALSEALIHFAGTVILVSHNRYLINKISTKILLLSKEKGLQEFKGEF
jgi:ATPase subunit of ABC transporter with duplicated ATPase domains